MPNRHHCVELPTVINNIEYTVQSRTIKMNDGSQQQEYRVLRDGLEIKSWTQGDLRPYFGAS
ncbi:hypothetical protein PQR62_05195 [Herbaspirillum lusitanum]|uniref:Uncharacterized protein n=1 Tax=Herbaspirillum lusitanum TaxID=213312 RepID=A0ABW9A702_9BURK